MVKSRYNEQRTCYIYKRNYNLFSIRVKVTLIRHLQDISSEQIHLYKTGIKFKLLAIPYFQEEIEPSFMLITCEPTPFYDKGLLESVPMSGRHGDTQTNKQLNRDDWGLTKLLSSGD